MKIFTFEWKNKWNKKDMWYDIISRSIKKKKKKKNLTVSLLTVS